MFYNLILETNSLVPGTPTHSRRGRRFEPVNSHQARYKSRVFLCDVDSVHTLSGLIETAYVMTIKKPRCHLKFTPRHFYLPMKSFRLVYLIFLQNIIENPFPNFPSLVFSFKTCFAEMVTDIDSRERIFSCSM